MNNLLLSVGSDLESCRDSVDIYRAQGGLKSLRMFNNGIAVLANMNNKGE